ncbi:MAG: ABC transporter ATP-binding protein [Deltaproteobacteria bacterium]|jgi:branched-chain amino acid transport system ATP-binding protein|nr:ABC transporter ATP-binding protein [Deltaproteobacteria bacterium]MBT4267208.1 ABC transporter ATP-binding protein [Deltaproteobacteria bacterium]
MSLLNVKNLEVSYGPVNVAKGISFSIEKGSIVTILGANGAGKTTILRTISGLIEPDKGQLLFNGIQIQDMEPEEIVKIGISHVPEGREIFPELSIRKNLMMGGFIRKDKGQILKDLNKVYDYFPILGQRYNQLAYTLSGGQQQMLVIGRALMSKPKLLLLDEPSLGLSPALVKEIFNIIKQINLEEKVTILLVEQNAKMALSVAQHGYILEVGRIVMDDSTQNLSQNEDVQEFYLGMKEEGIRGTRRWKKKKQWR